MVSGPITSWQIDGKRVLDFILGGSKITMKGYCCHEITGHLLLGRKAMTNLDCIKKQRYYVADKDPYGISNGFSTGHVWM